MAIIWDPMPEPIADADLLSCVEAMTYAGRAPFHDSSIALLGEISKAIFASPQGRAQPQYVALGFWLRPAAIKRMCDVLAPQDASRHLVPVPRGIALHLPPTNVDTIFVYSWAVSVLAGNCNIVRLPSEIDANTSWLASLVAGVIKSVDAGHRQLFCQLPQSGKLVEGVSALCDLRMIWGGDAKVESVSKIPIRPDGISIGFPDRTSLAIIDSATYRQASEKDRDELAAQFFNDVYWFNQMGCGSPRTLYWLGDPGLEADDFFQRVDRQTTFKKHHTETGVAIGKFAEMNRRLANGSAAEGMAYSNALHVLERGAPKHAENATVGGGFIVQTMIQSLEEVATDVSRKTQTLTYFGLSKERLRELANAISGRGGYRIVPIGQALQFDLVWDGLDLVQHMTKNIAIKE